MALSEVHDQSFHSNGRPPREAELLLRAQRGDRAAFGQFMDLCRDRLYNAMLRMVGEVDEARELVEESFVRGIDRVKGFRGDGPAYLWIFKIAIGLAISQLRKNPHPRSFGINSQVQPGGLVNQASDLNWPPTGSNNGGDPEALRRRQNLLTALGRLDSEYRAILVMRDIENFDYEQIAQALELPPATLKSRLFRARLALRDEILRLSID